MMNEEKLFRVALAAAMDAYSAKGFLELLESVAIKERDRAVHAAARSTVDAVKVMHRRRIRKFSAIAKHAMKFERTLSNEAD